MARIFISYSRVDRQFVDALADKLRRIYGHDNVWFDEGLHGGDVWWEEILKQIAERDIFIYVLSNDSVQSAYCQAEFAEARRLQKQIITVQARDRTSLTDELGDIHYIDMANGVDDADALTDLYRSVNKRVANVPKRMPRPLWEPATPNPGKLHEKPRAEDAPDVDTPMLEVPRAERENQQFASITWWKKPGFIVGAILVSVIVVVLGLVAQNIPQPSPTDIAKVSTHTPTKSPTNALSPTLSGTEREMTVQAEILQIQTEAAQTVQANQTATPTMATAFAQMTIYAQATTDAQATQTATLWTPTATPDARRTAEARLTLTRDAEIAQATQQSRDLTATATLWTLTPTLSPEQIALTPVSSNADWTPVERNFDGITMVLVPAGCFMMGSAEDSDEQPVHQQCFERPFWIDKYEVTQANFAGLGGQKANPNYFTGDRLPVEQIIWFESRDFCELRGMRLPTEAEWEYAARGPDSLVYPWGNTWNVNNLVWDRGGSQGTANVGSIPAGISWVGALDMSGNVWEWVSSLYAAYPYDNDQEGNRNTNSVRVLRGGSWIDFNSGLFRAANRYGFNPNFRGSYFGFRCARSS